MVLRQNSFVTGCGSTELALGNKIIDIGKVILLIFFKKFKD